jgi:uncharacterized SAM-binding protein YcdF (DUF218 family)
VSLIYEFMGLFLSKLFPLLIYPLGLSCVLLIVGIFFFWKRPRLTAIVLCISLSLQLITGNYWFSQAIVQSLEFQNIPQQPLPQAAAIVVLGGGTLSASPPRPWVEVAEAGDRVLYGAKLYRDGKAPLVILSGGRVEWYGAGPPEAADMAELLQGMGVPNQAIVLETASNNTYENAVNVQKILQQRQITGPLLLVTSAMHMPRALAIFRHLKMTTIAAPTDFRTTRIPDRQGFGGFVISLFPDAEEMYKTTLALKEYVGLFIYRLQGRL